jgi:DNA modification methylase
LISQSTSAGELVVDPFMGTASSGVAAARLGRSYWGCDISEKAIAIASDRLRATGVAGFDASRAPELAESPGQLGLQLGARG